MLFTVSCSRVQWTISHLDSKYSVQTQRNKTAAVWMSQSLASLSVNSFVSLPLKHQGLFIHFGNRFIWNYCHWRYFLQAHGWVGENNKNHVSERSKNFKPSVCAATNWWRNYVTRDLLWLSRSESQSAAETAVSQKHATNRFVCWSQKKKEELMCSGAWAWNESECVDGDAGNSVFCSRSQ